MIQIYNCLFVQEFDSMATVCLSFVGAGICSPGCLLLMLSGGDNLFHTSQPSPSHSSPRASASDLGCVHTESGAVTKMQLFPFNFPRGPGAFLRRFLTRSKKSVGFRSDGEIRMQSQSVSRCDRHTWQLTANLPNAKTPNESHNATSHDGSWQR